MTGRGDRAITENGTWRRIHLSALQSPSSPCVPLTCPMAPVLGEFPPWHPEPHAHSLCASGGAGKGRRHGGAASLGRTGSPQWGLGSEGSRPRCGQAFLQTPERENESTRLLKRQRRPPRLLRLHQSPGPSALGCSAGAPPPLGPAVPPKRWVLLSLREGLRRE